MLFRKTNVALLALCMSACVAVGCGPDDENASDNNKTTADMGTTTADMPGTTADMPGTTTDMPGTTTDMPGTTTDMPGTTTDMPGTTTDMPGTTDMPVGDDMTTPDMPEDMDVPGVCGDGEVTGNETCDGDCISSPTECDDNDACTINAVQGSAAQCNSVCDFSQPVTMCDGGQSDGCCPAGCDGSNDADCDPVMMSGQAGSVCTADGDCGPAGSATCLTEAQDADFIGGYCLTEIGCQTDPDCGGDGVCLTIDQNGTTACADGCVADGDCRTGYTCQDVGGPTACLPAPPQGAGNAGIACAIDTDCGTDGFCVVEADFVDGYCVTTLGCTDDPSCGGDNICLTLDQNGTTGCVDGCVADMDCRTGYTCQDLGGVSACFPTPAPITGVTGIACTADIDCDDAERCIGADEGFPTGYCSRDCQADAECPTGSHCGSFGICVDECAADSDCRTDGYVCVDADQDQLSECLSGGSGAGAIGALCDNASACAGRLDGLCVTEENGWKDGYCSLNCTVDADCGVGSHCGFNDQGNGACLLDCQVDNDCRGGTDGYSCTDADSDGVNECAPGGTGVGAVGDVCATVADCAGGGGALCILESQGFDAGYCSVQCVADADCATGHCSTQFGVCLDSCAMDSECRTPGYLCDDADADQVLECFPGSTGTGALGTACTDTSECAGRLDAFCLAEADNSAFSGGYCLTSGCIVDADCAAGGVCLEQQGGDNLCVDGCATDADCRSAEGYTCQPLVQNGPNVACFPAP